MIKIALNGIIRGALHIRDIVAVILAPAPIIEQAATDAGDIESSPEVTQDNGDVTTPPTYLADFGQLP